jgi:ParB family chromosome partitioning protein
MTEKTDLLVRLIPIENIQVVNPRDRGQCKFRQIVANIGKLGLKKPITVCPREGRNGHTRYDLVCGQGRLEAYKALGQDTVPALIIHVTPENLMLMSLTENLARRRHTAFELSKAIGAMRANGQDFAEIARKVDLKTEYVKGIVRLLEKGESGLLTAVEAGHIPITIAITIASASDEAVQKALAEAYENNTLRGKSILKARKLIEHRRIHGKSFQGAPKKDKKVSAQKLLRTFNIEMNKHRLLVHKAKIAETRLLFITEAMKSLLGDENFVNLLRAEKLDTIPTYISEQIKRKEATSGGTSSSGVRPSGAQHPH